MVAKYRRNGGGMGMKVSIHDRDFQQKVSIGNRDFRRMGGEEPLPLDLPMRDIGMQKA